ncbi:hypothetical protein ACFX13_020308 [Malus domestica]
MAGIDLYLYIPSLWRLCYHLPFSHHSDRTTVAGNYAFSGKFPVSNWSSPRHCPFVQKSLNLIWFAHKVLSSQGTFFNLFLAFNFLSNQTMVKIAEHSFSQYRNC